MRHDKIIGKRFSRYVVKEELENRCGMRRVLVKCDCGTEKEVYLRKLTEGKTTGCHCFHNFCKKNKLPRDKIKSLWNSIMVRCYNKDFKFYNDYGGRGIGVCKEWHDVLSFAKWFKDSNFKKGLTIERKNNSKGYSPSNCKWATVHEQTRNRRSNINITYRNETHCITDWSLKCGIKYATLRGRYFRGDRGEKLFREVKNDR